MEHKEDIIRPRKALALKLGIVGSGSGLISGLILILSGGGISSITGHKDDTLVLGLLTIILSGFALYCAYRSSRETSTDINGRIAWLLGMSIPAIVCFTTAGFLWLLPGSILLISTGIFINEMIKEFEEARVRVIASIPHWKRTAALAGVLVIVVPVIFGSFTENTELASFDDDEGSYYIQPMSTVKRNGDDGNTTTSEVTGIMLVHMILLIGGFAALISGQLGARTITILSGVVVMLSLLLFFLIIPNILFIEGAQMTQFDSDHFSSISGGGFLALFGSVLIVSSQFIKTKPEGTEN